MSYEWENTEMRWRLTVGSDEDGPFLGCEDGAVTCVGLPTDACEVEGLVRAILQATGCEIGSDGSDWGVVKSDE